MGRKPNNVDVQFKKLLYILIGVLFLLLISIGGLLAKDAIISNIKKVTPGARSNLVNKLNDLSSVKNKPIENKPSQPKNKKELLDLKVFNLSPRGYNENYGFETYNNYSSVKISPDETKIMAKESYPDVIFVWDLKTTKKLYELFDHNGSVNTFIFSPDSKQIATAGDEAIVRIWDSKNGKLLQTLTKHENLITFLEYSPDNKYLVSIGKDNAIIWDTKTWKPKQILDTPDYLTSSVQFSPDSQYLLTVSDRNKYDIWQLQNDTGKFVKTKNKFSSGDSYYPPILSPDGKYLFLSLGLNNIILYDYKNDKLDKNINYQIERPSYNEFSPDNKYLVTGYSTGKIRIWDIEKGNVFQELEGHDYLVHRAIFSKDNKYLLSVSMDFTAKLWDYKNNKLLYTFDDFDNVVYRGNFSPDSKRIALSSIDGTVNVYDTETRKRIYHYKYKNLFPSYLEFSPDNKQLICGYSDGSTRIWNARTGELVHLLKGHKTKVLSAKYSPDNKHIATSSDDTNIIIWDRDTGNHLHTLSGNKRKVGTIHFNSDGSKLASGSWDGTVKIWEVKTGKLLFDIKTPSNQIISVDYSSDDKFIISTSDNDRVYVWDANTGKLVYELNSYFKNLNRAIISNDNKFIVTSSDSDNIKLWNTKTGKLYKELDLIHENTSHATINNNGTVVVSCFNNTYPAIANIQNLFSSLVYLNTEGAKIFHTAFSPDDKLIITASDDNTAKIWELKPNDIVDLKHTLNHSAKVYHSSFSHNGKLAASTSKDNTAKIWDVNTGELKHTLKHNDEVYYSEFSPDNKFVVTAGVEPIARIWNTSNGKVYKELIGHKDTINQAKYTPDSKNIITASNDNSIIIWDALTGKAIHKLNDHKNKVYSISFSPDNKHFVSASADGTAIVWDINSGKLLTKLEGHESNVNSAKFSPDGKTIITASDDQVIKIWDPFTGDTIHSVKKKSGKLYDAQYVPNTDDFIISSELNKPVYMNHKYDRFFSGSNLTKRTIFNVSFSKDGKFLALSGNDKIIKLYNLKSGKLAKEFDCSDMYLVNRPIYSYFSPDSKYVLVVTHVALRLIDINSGNIVYEFNTNPEKNRYDVFTSKTFSSSGDIIAAAVDKKGIFLWYLNDSKYPTSKYSDQPTESAKSSESKEPKKSKRNRKSKFKLTEPISIRRPIIKEKHKQNNLSSKEINELLDRYTKRPKDSEYLVVNPGSNSVQYQPPKNALNLEMNITSTSTNCSSSYYTNKSKKLNDQEVEMHIISVDTEKNRKVIVKKSKKPIMLVLSSRYKNFWDIEIEPGAKLKEILFLSNEPQYIKKLNKPVKISSKKIRDYRSYWETNDKDFGESSVIFREYLADVRALTNLTEASFQGVHTYKNYTVPNNSSNIYNEKCASKHHYIDRTLSEEIKVSNEKNIPEFQKYKRLIKSLQKTGKLPTYYPVLTTSSYRMKTKTRKEAYNLDPHNVYRANSDNIKIQKLDNIYKLLVKLLPKPSFVQIDGIDSIVIASSFGDIINSSHGDYIIIPGKGNDEITSSRGSDIIIIEKDFGNDVINKKYKGFSSDFLGSSSPEYIEGYKWKYPNFIIFDRGIKPEDMVWIDNYYYDKASNTYFSKENIITDKLSFINTKTEKFISPEKMLEMIKQNYKMKNGKEISNKDLIVTTGYYNSTFKYGYTPREEWLKSNRIIIATYKETIKANNIINWCNKNLLKKTGKALKEEDWPWLKDNYYDKDTKKAFNKHSVQEMQPLYINKKTLDSLKFTGYDCYNFVFYQN